MKGLVVGSTASLALVGLGLFWWQGRAQVEEGAPPPMVVESEAPLPEVPPVDPGEAIGPAPPEATELTREQRRFFRYDRNRDWRINRTEMLSTAPTRSASSIKMATICLISKNGPWRRSTSSKAPMPMAITS